MRDISFRDPPRERQKHEPLHCSLQGPRAEGFGVTLAQKERIHRSIDIDKEPPPPDAAPLEHQIDLAMRDLRRRLLRKRTEMDDPIEPIQKLRTENAAQLFRRARFHILLPRARIESDRHSVGNRRADIGGEDDDRAAEVGGSTLAVGEPPGIEDLQAEVIHIHVSLLDFIEEQNREGLLFHHRSQCARAAMLTDQALEGLVSGILAHVEAMESARIAEA